MLGISQVTTRAIKRGNLLIVPDGVVMEEDQLQDATEVSNAERTLEEGIEHGYGRWLQPFVENEGEPANPTSETAASNSSDPTPTDPEQRRKRGRPRVNTVRNGSAIEKRRAQVRNAQRSYQKRKDEASNTVNQRCDELLQVLSDLATTVEETLSHASKAGTLNQKDDMAAQMRHLWDSYDAVINQPSVQPELRLLKVKNDRRQADHQSKQNYLIHQADKGSSWGSNVARLNIGNHEGSGPSDVHGLDFSNMTTGRADDTTMIQSFHDIRSSNKGLGGRSIFDIVAERQAQLRNSESQTP